MKAILLAILALVLTGADWREPKPQLANFVVCHTTYGTRREIYGWHSPREFSIYRYRTLTVSRDQFGMAREVTVTEQDSRIKLDRKMKYHGADMAKAVQDFASLICLEECDVEFHSEDRTDHIPMSRLLDVTKPIDKRFLRDEHEHRSDALHEFVVEVD